MDLPKRESAPRNELGAGKYLKLADGDKKVGVFRGKIHSFAKIFEEKREVPVGTPGASTRYKLNFVTKVDGKYTALVWEFGVTVYDQLADLNEMYPIEETVVTVKRTGKGKDNTRYSVLPVPNATLKGAQLKEIEAIPLNVLQSAPAPSESDFLSQSFGDPPEFENEESLPF